MIMSQERRNLIVLASVFGIVLGMGALAFASAPLYSLFCQVTGFGGTTQVAGAAPAEDEIRERRITVQFNTDTASRLPWRFTPGTRRMELQIGQEGFIAFNVGNRSNRALAGTAVYNVTPLKAGKYFQKTQCFCFESTVLNAGTKTKMPVVFHIDPDFADDPDMEDVRTITLSYTFFPSDSRDLDAAMEAFYDSEQKIPSAHGAQNPSQQGT